MGKRLTEDEIGLVRTLWDQGLSGSQIGRRIGRTRNSILGLARRLGLPSRDQIKSATDSANMQWMLRRRRKAKPISGASLRRKAPEPRHQTPATPVEAPAHPPVALLDLKPWHCRYPVEGGFCGAKTCSRGSRKWCAHHADIVYRGFPERKERAAQ